MNFDDAETPTDTRDPRWHVDHGRALVGTEPPGDPVPDGPWERACAVLRVSAAATFAAHGLEAIFQEPAFFDYLFVFSRDFLGDPWSAATIEHTLVAIGVLDLVVAALVLVTRGRLVPAWMVFWGVLTAFARIVHSGPQAWDEVALRFPNFLVPLALVWAACPRTDRQPSPDP